MAETAAAVTNWANNLGLTYPLLLDTNSTVYNQYGMGYIPHNALLDTSMMVLYTFYGYDEPLLLSIIDNYYSPVFTQGVSVSTPFMRKNLDTLTINTQFVNPENHPLLVKAIITSLDSSLTDSIPLYDDGNHDDGQAGDMLYGGYLPPLSEENEFMIAIKMTDLGANVQNIFPDQARFTTIGPITIANYQEVLRIPPNKIYYKFELQNEGLIKTANNISARLSTTDPLVTNILGSIQNFGNIAPGQTSMNQNNYGILVSNLPNSYTIRFNLQIYSEGNLFWQDSTDVVVNIHKDENNFPTAFSLKQNYPNPFNPSTTIGFDLPKTAYVTLKVFNNLGEEVSTLVSKTLSAGSYSYEWDASNLASGVYLYRLQTEGYVENRKMILMK